MKICKIVCKTEKTYSVITVFPVKIYIHLMNLEILGGSQVFS